MKLPEILFFALAYALPASVLDVTSRQATLLAQYPWKMTNLLRIGGLGDASITLQHVNVEEAQGREP